MTDTTEDDFLGGRIRLNQPANGYRAGIDPVLLAAAVPACTGQSVLELGTGAGVALACLLARVPGLDAVGVERDAEAARLARDNLAANGLSARILTADVAEPPESLRARTFDHVMANPPFFDRARGSGAIDPGREAGRGLETPMAVWIDAAIRRTKPKGRITFIGRAEELPGFLSALGERVGDIHVLPIASRRGRCAKLALLQAKKGTRGRFRLLAPLVMHKGDRHLADGDDYSDRAVAILRHGAELSLEALGNP